MMAIVAERRHAKPGKVEPGERTEQALIRELHGENGVSDVIARKGHRPAWMPAIAALCIAALSMCAAKAADPVAEQLTRTAVAGRPAEIGQHARWDTNCEAAAPPRVSLERPPAHGTVCMAEGPIRPVMSRSGAALNCVGTTLRGLHIVYIPHASFAGADALRYVLDAPEGHVSRDITIVIMPDRDERTAPTISATTEPQPPGPLPECPRPVS